LHPAHYSDGLLCVCVCVCVYIYIHIYIYTHIHTQGFVGGTVSILGGHSISHCK
jgi:hypothetical protein